MELYSPGSAALELRRGSLCRSSQHMTGCGLISIDVLWETTVKRMRQQGSTKRKKEASQGDGHIEVETGTNSISKG